MRRTRASSGVATIFDLGPEHDALRALQHRSVERYRALVECLRFGSKEETVIPLSCSFVSVILTPVREPGGDQLVQQTFTEGSLQTEKAARLWEGKR